MSRGPGPRLPPLDFTKPRPGDSIDAAPPATSRRWDAAMAWFMRGVAVLWLAKGLLAWATILGLWSPLGPFEGADAGAQAATIYFAAIDPIAAVALWMAGTWGGVLWLLAAMSHLILAFFVPGLIPGNLFVSLVFMALIVVYLALSWTISHEE